MIKKPLLVFISATVATAAIISASVAVVSLRSQQTTQEVSLLRSQNAELEETKTEFIRAIEDLMQKVALVDLSSWIQAFLTFSYYLNGSSEAAVISSKQEDIKEIIAKFKKLKIKIPPKILKGDIKLEFALANAENYLSFAGNLKPLLEDKLNLPQPPELAQKILLLLKKEKPLLLNLKLFYPQKKVKTTLNAEVNLSELLINLVLKPFLK